MKFVIRSALAFSITLLFVSGCERSGDIPGGWSVTEYSPPKGASDPKASEYTYFATLRSDASLSSADATAFVLLELECSGARPTWDVGLKVPLEYAPAITSPKRDDLGEVTIPYQIDGDTTKMGSFWGFISQGSEKHPMKSLHMVDFMVAHDLRGKKFVTFTIQPPERPARLVKFSLDSVARVVTRGESVCSAPGAAFKP